jgi:glutathione S-transferase
VNPLPILYSFRRCPYAIRARLALAVSKQRYELREIVLRNKPAAMLQASPKGTVPVLILPDGTVIDESLDIMNWALNCADPGHWLVSGERPEQCAGSWIARCDTEFKAALDRYKYPHRFGNRDGNAARNEASVFLQDLQNYLSNRPFLAGSQYGRADAAIAPFVRQFAHVDTAWFAGQDWPELQRWLQQFEQSARLASVMQKLTPWVEGQAPVTLPDSATDPVPSAKITNGNHKSDR